MKKPNRASPNEHQQYQDFFLQLPVADYLDSIKTQEDTDQPHDLAVHGLSDEQVSQIALDSLRDARKSRRQHSDETKQDPSRPSH